MKQKKEYQYPTWAWIVFGLILIFALLRSPFVALIALAIFFGLMEYFTRWAIKIKKSPLVPFFIVALLGLLGFFVYWTYYKYRLKIDESNKRN